MDFGLSSGSDSRLIILYKTRHFPVHFAVSNVFIGVSFVIYLAPYLIMILVSLKFVFVYLTINLNFTIDEDRQLPYQLYISHLFLVVFPS